MTLPGNTQTFTYTHADQVLTQANTDTAYTYSSTMEYVAFGVNDLNQIASATQSGSTSTITYDNRGNLTSDGGASYDYNVYNGLTSYSPNVGAGVTLNYDAENRIHSLNQTGTWTKFLYGLNGEIIAEYNGSNQVIRRYLHGPGSDEPLVWYEGSGSGDRRYLHADRLGSIVATTDNGGNRINVSTYDAYGLKSHSNVAYASRFQFTGQAYLSEIGLYYYKARMYHPRIGRFLQPDPIGYGDGLNMYAYVGNDPVNMVDPFGLAEQKPCPPGQDPCEVVVEGTKDGYVPHLGSNMPYMPPVLHQQLDFDHGAEDIEEVIVVAQRGKQNYRSSEFEGLSDEELEDRYRNDKSLSSEELNKIKREFKYRGVRNIDKRKRGSGRFVISPYDLIPYPTFIEAIRCDNNIRNGKTCEV